MKDKEQLAKQYAENKSSSDVFRETHKKDFIAGWEACFLSFSTEKRIKQQILDLKNKYKSNLQGETYSKLTKTINKDKINELLIKLSVIDEIENKL